MAGSKKARVFPDPVALMPIMSRPNKAIGQPWLWIGDAVVDDVKDVYESYGKRDICNELIVYLRAENPCFNTSRRTYSAIAKDTWLLDCIKKIC